MNEFEVLSIVRNHLITEGGLPCVHLAVPPKPLYPLVLLELEEIWTSYSTGLESSLTDIQGRVKFKVSAYSQNPGMNEVAALSYKIKRTLEGLTLRLPGLKGELPGGGKLLILRFLSSIAETEGSSTLRRRTIHQFYDSIIRGRYEPITK